MMLIVLFLAFTCFHSSSSAQPSKTQKPSFIIAPQKKPTRSKSALKEHMGEEVERCMRICAALNKSLGLLQIDLAKLQNDLLSVGKNVLENNRPVKRAKRFDLQEGVRVLQLTAAQLDKQVQETKRVCSTLKNTTVLQGSAQILRSFDTMSKAHHSGRAPSIRFAGGKSLRMSGVYPELAKGQHERKNHKKSSNNEKA